MWQNIHMLSPHNDRLYEAAAFLVIGDYPHSNGTKPKRGFFFFYKYSIMQEIWRVLEDYG